MILENLVFFVAKLLTSSWAFLSTSSVLISITQPLALVPSSIISQNQSAAPLGNAVFYTPPPTPPEQGVIDGESAGSRGPCDAINPSLTALVPFVPSQPGNSQAPAWGLTTQEQPTFWVYVPYGTDAIRSGEISIREGEGDSEREFATAELDLTSTPGIIRVPFPSTASLEMNKWYKVEIFVDVYCSPNTRVQKDNVQVWVRRQDLTSTVRNELSQASTPLQRAIVYAENGFWYDALAAVVELRRNDLNDRNLETLLRSAGLDSIVSQPLMD